MLARKVRKAEVVSAFSTVPSEVLFEVFDAKKRRTRRRPSLMYCRDAPDAKDVAATFALAMAQLAYEGEEGPEVAYRIDRFGEVETEIV
jgi:hypothetical protein